MFLLICCIYGCVLYYFGFLDALDTVAVSDSVLARLCDEVSALDSFEYAEDVFGVNSQDDSVALVHCVAF